MLTYNSDPTFKKAFVAEVVKHRKADQIIQGSYGEQNGHWRGCAVACSLRSLDILKGNQLAVRYSQHKRFEAEGLWPEWLALLEDELFERLPKEDALKWPERIATAVPVGVNLDRVKWQFCAFLLSDNIERVLTLNISEMLKKQVVDAIRNVLVVHESAIETGAWNASAARSAASAAWSAASAAWSAASAAYQRYAKKLLSLLKAAR